MCNSFALTLRIIKNLYGNKFSKPAIVRFSDFSDNTIRLGSQNSNIGITIIPELQRRELNYPSSGGCAISVVYKPEIRIWALL